MRTLSARDFHLTSCQAGMITPGHELPRRQLFAELLPAWLVRFEEEPRFVAVDGEPTRIILEGGGWRFEFSAARADLFWIRRAPSVPALALEGFYEQASDLLGGYQRATGCRVGRLAALVQRIAGHDAPGLALARHFCQERWTHGALDRPEQFELHAHKRYALAGRFLVNSWVRCRSAPQFGPQAIAVDQDINTLAAGLEGERGTGRSPGARAVLPIVLLQLLLHPLVGRRRPRHLVAGYRRTP
jgi:hypothetical protein